MNINPKTIYILASGMMNYCPPALPVDDYGACPPKPKRKKIKGWQKKGKRK